MTASAAGVYDSGSTLIMKRREEKLSSKQMGEHEAWCECGFEHESSRRHRYVLFIPPVKR